MRFLKIFSLAKNRCAIIDLLQTLKEYASNVQIIRRYFHCYLERFAAQILAQEISNFSKQDPARNVEAKVK